MSGKERSFVAATIMHFQGDRYDVLSYVVMDDHVHVVVRPRGEHTLLKILHSWKSFSARRIAWSRREPGPYWTSETMDRVLRDEYELNQKIVYTISNPWRRWPELEEYGWVQVIDADGTLPRTTRMTREEMLGWL